jgi:hypothetical protein
MENLTKILRSDAILNNELHVSAIQAVREEP